MSVDDVADEIVRTRRGGHRTGVRIGLIGEIGVSKDFTAEEEKIAARRRARAGAHAAAADRSICRAGTGSAIACSTSSRRRAAISGHTVLCHMNPSFDDLAIRQASPRAAPSSNTT